jgi:hypothetical protein
MKHGSRHDVVKEPKEREFLVSLFSLMKDLDGGRGRTCMSRGKRERCGYISVWVYDLFMPFEPQNYMTNAGFTFSGINFTNLLLPS